MTFIAFFIDICRGARRKAARKMYGEKFRKKLHKLGLNAVFAVECFIGQKFANKFDYN